MTFCWALALLGAAFGAVMLLMGFMTAASAPQEAAAAALAAALAIVPYCFARAIEGLRGTPVEELQAIRERLESHSKLLAHLANHAPDVVGETTTEPAATFPLQTGCSTD
jgi:hypothetical protein